MLGAIIGDIVGSRFEWHNNKSKDFDFLTYRCRPTDDSIMSLAIAKAILNSKDINEVRTNSVAYMQELGRKYPDAGYGGHFSSWLRSNNPQPYNSWGNGSAMRVSACGFAANSIDEAISLAKATAEVTHNHPEGIKGAVATAVAIYMARTGSNILEIQDYINKHYYKIDFKLDEIRDNYTFDVSCQCSVPQALEAFFESTSFEDAIRNAISIGGDSDTIAAITGGIAEAYYGIPSDIRSHALTFLADDILIKILTDFENKYPSKVEITTEKSSYAVDTPDNAKITGNNRSELLTASYEQGKSVEDSINSNAIETTPQYLFQKLYAAATVLYGHVEKAAYRTYLIPLLFFKRISDVYDEEIEDAIKEYGVEGAKFMGNSIHSFEIPDGYHWNDIRNATENVGKVIADTLAKIEQANPKTLSGVFSSFDGAAWANKVILSDETLKNLVEKMSEVNVGNKSYSADVMGDAYEYLLKQFAEDAKKNGGQFYTPRSVVKLLVKILDPKSGETVYDPTCGTGGMLIESIRHMDNQKMAYGKIFGQEINMTTSAIARMNLYLHGAHDFTIEQGDTLRTPKFFKGGQIKTFDNVIANPPFGLSGWGADAFETDQYGRNIWGCPSDSNADFAWIQHMVASMDPIHGKCVVIMPQGVLFHGGKEGEIRKKLIQSDKVEAVITFVGGLFFGAGVSACVLYLNNNKPAAHRGKVLLIDGSTIYTAKRAQNIMSDDDVEKAFKLYQEYTDVVGYSKVVTLEDLEKNDYTLAVNSYIEKPKAPPIDPVKVKQEYFAALENVKECENKLYNLLKEGGYLE